MKAITTIFHEGELSVQARAGLEENARNTAAIVLHSTIPRVAQEFLCNQRMVIVASTDERSRVWASVLTGRPGFIHTGDNRTVYIDASPLRGDPLAENVRHNNALGIFVVEFSTHRRMKVKGTGEVSLQGALILHAERVYSQCEKYIQTRELATEISDRNCTGSVARTNRLNSEQQWWIRRADTFFIASFHPATGADAAHRGGNPGFVRPLGGSTLLFPDYQGNSMFNTLGNITSNPHAGLLFLDFEKGDTLQLTGTATIVWDTDHIRMFAGAQRLVEFHLDEAIEITGGMPLQWRLIAHSSFNPAQ